MSRDAGKDLVQTPEIQPAAPGTKPEEKKGNPGLAETIGTVLGNPPDGTKAEEALEIIAEPDKHKATLLDILTMPDDDFFKTFEPTGDKTKQQEMVQAMKFYGDINKKALLEQDITELVNGENPADDTAKAVRIQELRKNMQQKMDNILSRIHHLAETNPQSHQTLADAVIAAAETSDQGDAKADEAKKEDVTLETLQKQLAELRQAMKHQADMADSPFTHIVHLLHGIDPLLSGWAQAMAESEVDTKKPQRGAH